jgi:hypothetical protein
MSEERCPHCGYLHSEQVACRCGLFATKSEHATVRVGEYTVPLIWVPPEATEETCDKCGKKCHIGDMSLSEDMKTICPDCKQAQNKKDNQ